METFEQRLGRVLTALHLDSIRNKILVLAVLATLVPALSTAGLSYVRTRAALTETLEGELQGVGSQSSRELDLWVRDRFFDLRVFVGSFEVTENLDRIRQGGPGSADALTRLSDYFVGIQARFPDYTDLIVLDDGGEAVPTSGRGLTTPELPPDWLAALRRRETRLGAPFWDEALASVAVIMAVPIESADARFLGVLLGTLTFDAVEAMLTDLSPGEGGRIDLISADGRIIAASVPVTGFEQALPAQTLVTLSEAASSTREYVDNAGIDMVGTLIPIERLDWAVLAHLPSAEAYAPITRLRNSTLLLVSFLLIVVGTVAWFIGIFIVRPLARLAEGAAAVAGGDLSVDLPVTGKDEVGYLTEVFNGMVAQLRTNRQELDEASAVLREQNVELERISMTDALTALFNRRYVMNEFDKEINRADRHERTLAVLMMDVDRFKQYNDTFGHQAGDEVLRGMGRVIRDATREPDVPARYGGEEFIVLLPDCDIHGAIDAAERVRKRLAQEVFEGRTVTISIGAAEFPTHGESPTALIASADAALYEAKHAGRDQVMAAGQTAPTSSADDQKTEEAAPPKKRATPEKGAAKKGAAKRRTAAEQKADAKKGALPSEAAPKKEKVTKKKAVPKKKAVAKKEATPKKAPGKTKSASE